MGQPLLPDNAGDRGPGSFEQSENRLHRQVKSGGEHAGAEGGTRELSLERLDHAAQHCGIEILGIDNHFRLECCLEKDKRRVPCRLQRDHYQLSAVLDSTFK